MSIYIVCSCFLENIDSKDYITEVLMKFTQKNNYRVGIDTEKKLIDIYYDIADNNAGIAAWLELMTYKPTAFEEITQISADISNKIEMFLFVCKCVVNKNCIIVNTIQNFVNYDFLEEKKIKYKDKTITFLEKDDAVEEFRNKDNSTNIFDSIVATNNSSIEDVKK